MLLFSNQRSGNRAVAETIHELGWSTLTYLHTLCSLPNKCENSKYRIYIHKFHFEFRYICMKFELGFIVVVQCAVHYFFECMFLFFIATFSVQLLLFTVAIESKWFEWIRRQVS